MYMSFINVLQNAGMMIIWWVGGAIGICLGLFLLWLGFPKPNVNWFFTILGLVLIGVSVLAIAYGTSKHNMDI